MTAEYESERTVTREEATAISQELTDGIAAGVLSLGQEGEQITLDIPDEVAIELEVEAEDEEVSVEFELEWPDPNVADVASDIEELADSLEEDEELLDPIETGDSVEAVDHSGEGRDDADEIAPDPTEATESLAHFEVFRDRADEWRWRLVHQNGNVIAASGEGYTRKHNALKGLRSVRRNSPAAEVVDQSDE